MVNVMRLMTLPRQFYFILPFLIFPTYLSAADLNPFGCKFNDMEAFYRQQLGIENVHIEYKFQRVKDHKLQGFAQQTRKNQYRITLADWLEDSELRVTMAHELVHVRQLENGQIDRSEFEKHYLDRSFEDEAFRLSIPLAVDFYTKHKCIEKNHKKP